MVGGRARPESKGEKPEKPQKRARQTQSTRSRSQSTGTSSSATRAKGKLPKFVDAEAQEVHGQDAPDFDSPQEDSLDLNQSLSDEEEDDTVQDTQGETKLQKARRIEEAIACFFEERSFFYDQADEDYKNRERRKMELREFAKTIGWHREYYLVRSKPLS